MYELRWIPCRGVKQMATASSLFKTRHGLILRSRSLALLDEWVEFFL
jgi:hypothetical protein